MRQLRGRVYLFRVGVCEFYQKKIFPYEGIVEKGGAVFDGTEGGFDERVEEKQQGILGKGEKGRKKFVLAGNLFFFCYFNPFPPKENQSPINIHT